MSPEQRRAREELAITGVSPAFIARVEDARARLKAGESIASVRQRHGSVVLKEATRGRQVER